MAKPPLGPPPAQPLAAGGGTGRGREGTDRAQPFWYATYPQEGATKTVAAGDMEVDFRDGKVTLPGSTSENVIMLPKGEKGRSLYWETSVDVDVSFDGAGQFYTYPANNLHGVVWWEFEIVRFRFPAGGGTIKLLATNDSKAGPVRG